MFTKLRNKFLILNMSITSLVIIAAFAVIYLITYSNIQSGIQKRLNPQSGMQISIEGTDLPDDAGKGRSISTGRYIYSDDPLLFNIEVDANGKVLRVDANPLINIPNEAYYKAAGVSMPFRRNSLSIQIPSILGSMISRMMIS